jgi:Arm DNA-binding domain
MAKVTLADRFINSDKRRPRNGRVDYPDALVPELALRVRNAGHKTFVLIARYPFNPKNPTRRALGEVGKSTLEQARAKGRRWLELIGKGIDPKADEARQRAEQRRQVNSFAAVAMEYLTREATKLAHSVQARRIIESEFVKRWGSRPVTDILPEEAAAAIRAIVKRGAPAQARNAFGHGSRMFGWPSALMNSASQPLRSRACGQRSLSGRRRFGTVCWRTMSSAQSGRPRMVEPAPMLSPRPAAATCGTKPAAGVPIRTAS